MCDARKSAGSQILSSTGEGRKAGLLHVQHGICLQNVWPADLIHHRSRARLRVSSLRLRRLSGSFWEDLSGLWKLAPCSLLSHKEVTGTSGSPCLRTIDPSAGLVSTFFCIHGFLFHFRNPANAEDEPVHTYLRKSCIEHSRTCFRTNIYRILLLFYLSKFLSHLSKNRSGLDLLDAPLPRVNRTSLTWVFYSRGEEEDRTGQAGRQTDRPNMCVSKNSVCKEDETCTGFP